GDVPRRLNLSALEEYLALGYVPAPLSLIEGIEKLLPGHYLVVEQGGIENREYWDVPFGEPEEHSEAEWIEQIRAKLLETVKMQLISDVPLGAFLSGGIDSSTIVAAMAKMTDRPVKTYSIGYEGEHSYYNELPYAKAVAQAFHTEHHEIVVHPEVSQWLPKLLFHIPQDRHSSWKDYARYAAAFVKSAELDPASRYMGYVTLFAPQVQRELLRNKLAGNSNGSDLAAAALQNYFRRRTDSDSLNRIIYADLKTSLADDLLAMTDRMSMAASIECRAPLVDFELVELAS